MPETALRSCRLPADVAAVRRRTATRRARAPGACRRCCRLCSRSAEKAPAPQLTRRPCCREDLYARLLALFTDAAAHAPRGDASRARALGALLPALAAAGAGLPRPAGAAPGGTGALAPAELQARQERAAGLLKVAHASRRALPSSLPYQVWACTWYPYAPGSPPVSGPVSCRMCPDACGVCRRPTGGARGCAAVQLGARGAQAARLLSTIPPCSVALLPR